MCRWFVGPVVLCVGITLSVFTGGLSAQDSIDNLPVLVRLLQETEDTPLRRDVLVGICVALEGQRSVAMPTGWQDLYPALINSRDAEVRGHAIQLAVLFGDARAISTLHTMINDRTLPLAQRRAALATLAARRSDGFENFLYALIDDEQLGKLAIGHLAGIRSSRTPQVLLDRYPQLDEQSQMAVVNTLATRSDWARPLLEAIDRGVVTRKQITAVVARKIDRLGSREVRDKLHAVWGSVGNTSSGQRQLLRRYRLLLNQVELAAADVVNGRRLYQKACAKCHRLYGEGSLVGPDLTGSNRHNLDYLLENIVTPSAMVDRDFLATRIETQEGRVELGMIIEQNASVVTLQTAETQLLFPRDEIESITKLPQSMMPAGQLKNLTDFEVRDLIGYLQTNEQVPLP